VSGANTAKIQRRGRPFEKGQSGNPAGKPTGARHRATVAAEVLLDGEAETLTRKAVDMALAGNPIALRLCLDRILPPRRERPPKFALPPLRSVADAAPAIAAIFEAVAVGEVTAIQADALSKLVDGFVRASAASDAAEQKARVDNMFPGLSFGGR
jgi:hypothetical protein